MRHKTPVFLWIDDDASRLKYFRRVIETAPRGFKTAAKIEPKLVTANVLNELAEWSAPTQTVPDLLIIDHIFSKAGKMPLRIVGSSIAHILRKQWPDVPIVCVTAMLDIREHVWFDQEDLSEYTAIFPYTNLASHVEDLYAIARDFTKLRPKQREAVIQLARQLGVPKYDRDTFGKALPDEFHAGRHPTTHHRLARWIFNILLRRPGFLYDELRAATYLGLNLPGFRKVSTLFKAAEYRGPFHSSTRQRWWLSQLQELLYVKAKNASSDLPQLVGRTLPGISTADHSRCYVAERAADVPDAVAQLYPRGDWKAVCSRHTRPHPQYPAPTLGFEAVLAVSHKK
jgi:hypothetical protein